MATHPEIEVASIDRTFWRVTGADAESYLQGQLSQDLAALDDFRRAATLLLDPTGKVVSLLGVSREALFDRDRDGLPLIEPGGYLLDTDSPAAGATEARLRRFLLRVDVTIERLDGWACVRAFRAPYLPQASAISAWPGAPFPQDLVGPDAKAMADELHPTWLDAAEAERRRITAGMPVSGIDIGSDTIPGEIGAWAIEQAVSFTKGCYTGQELVARVDSRGGNVPHPMRVLTRVEGSPLVAPAELVLDGKVVGRVTSAVDEVALAAVNRAVAPGTVVVVRGDDGEATAMVEARPFSG